ncbi:AbrB/MazE/SpoVT family DNA-binding domain-containing protein [Candidatus Woesearchaeota archaeon]|nr:AbrB/MazE/SpoVT family DNA-binding domain-containing protein [Candidatus Woesearchaeota archaeon]
MHQRKVQNIAGMTYSVSLPKAWAQKHGIRPKTIVMMEEQDDGSLLVSPSLQGRAGSSDSISFNIDRQESSISHILYATYYLGYGNIRLFSRSEIPQKTRQKIKSTIQNLSGTEIVYEDMHRIEMKVLLDITKISIHQLLYRVSLIINSSIDCILNNEGPETISRNEDEIDRLYHLARKMIFLSSRDTGMLVSSGICQVSHAFSYSMINNKLEIIADNIADLALHISSLGKKSSDTGKAKDLLKFFRKRFSRDMGLLANAHVLDEHAADMTEIGKIRHEIDAVNDTKIKLTLSSMAGGIVEIEEEMMNLFYYRKLVESGNTE